MIDPSTDDIRFDPTPARRAAVRRALAIGVGSVGVGFALGKSPENALLDGLFVAIGGLIAWGVYHLVSHRDDALGLVAMNFLPLWRAADDPWLPTLVITSMAMLAVGLVMGFVNRPPAEADPGEFWWDAELDGPV